MLRKPELKQKHLLTDGLGSILTKGMQLQMAIHDVWIGGLALQGLLALVFLAKKNWRKFPVFFTYVFVTFTGNVICYAIHKHGLAYFYTFWAFEAVGIVLGLAVVREIFANLFSPHPALRKLAKMIFRVVMTGLIVLAAAILYARSGDAIGIANAVLLAAGAARIVEVGAIMFLFLSTSAFGLHWRQNVFGIALGLGMYAAVELVTVTFMTRVTPAIAQVLSLIHSLAFDFSLLVWLGYLLAPERATSSAEIPKRAQLEQWNQAVMELISR
jgi:hypothetical protein